MYNRKIIFIILLSFAAAMSGCSSHDTEGTAVTLDNGEQVGTIVTIPADESGVSDPSESRSSSSSSLETAASSGAGDDIIVARSTTVADEYVFNYYGTDIEPGQPADSVIEALGTGYEYYEQSTEASGSGQSGNTQSGNNRTSGEITKIYTYRDFTLYTRPSAGAYYISSIDINSADCSTLEGISTGASADEVVAAYGDGYTDNGDSITYKSGDSQLSFFFTDGTVSDITYDYIDN
ncbi:MAG: hypothetical protein LKG26_06380 [Saccharofermentans sp.]|jgi:hypothetical protein|nr:hypothetical protein [Mageeibacillus sp.]MCI1264844.1 hypothetical protein [Saccharofermentans sp.]MCI1275695.1 hypothetical protein [Saccharofermentans sp.]